MSQVALYRRLTSDIRWLNLSQACCHTLNQSDGNSSVRRISNDAAAKSFAGRPGAPPFFKSARWHFQMSGPVGVLLEMDWHCVLKMNLSWTLPYRNRYKLRYAFRMTVCFETQGHEDKFWNLRPMPQFTCHSLQLRARLEVSGLKSRIIKNIDQQ